MQKKTLTNIKAATLPSRNTWLRSTWNLEVEKIVCIKNRSNILIAFSFCNYQAHVFWSTDYIWLQLSVVLVTTFVNTQTMSWLRHTQNSNAQLRDNNEMFKYWAFYLKVVKEREGKGFSQQAGSGTVTGSQEHQSKREQEKDKVKKHAGGQKQAGKNKKAGKL